MGDIECLDSAAIIGNNTSEVIATVRFIAFAMTALIEGSNGMAMVSKNGSYQVPDMGCGGKTVNEQARRQIRARNRRKPTAIVDAEIVRINKVIYGVNNHVDRCSFEVDVRFG